MRGYVFEGYVTKINQDYGYEPASCGHF
jgi:hypothetical protein